MRRCRASKVIPAARRSATAATVANTGAYDIVANASIAGAPVSSFINNGLFEKTGGGGVSDVTSNFVNNGELDVLSGKVVFSGGFANTGVIHGLVTQSGGVTTISAQTPSDFNGDALSDILWQNTSGQGAIWEMNGTNVDRGGAIRRPQSRAELDRDRNRRLQWRRACRHPLAECATAKPRSGK